MPDHVLGEGEHSRGTQVMMAAKTTAGHANRPWDVAT